MSPGLALDDSAGLALTIPQDSQSLALGYHRVAQRTPGTWNVVPVWETLKVLLSPLGDPMVAQGEALRVLGNRQGESWGIVKGEP